MSIPMTRWFAAAVLVAVVSAPSAARSEVAMNAFACSLYRELAGQQENLFFSPFSVGTALAMTAEGARGETAREMGEALGLDAAMKRADAERPYDWSPLHVRLGQLADRLAPKLPPPQLLKQLSALRSKLERANATLEAATSYDQAYFDLGEEA